MSQGAGDQHDQTIFEDLLDHALDAVWIVDEAGLFAYANPAAETLTGYGRGELIGRPLSMILSPDVAASYAGDVGDDAARAADPPVLGALREIQLRQRSGDVIPVELRAFEVQPRAGRRRFGGIVRDIRERKRLEGERDALVERLAHLALADELTGLPNRRAFVDALDRLIAAMQRRGMGASVAVIDVDQFKAVNDGFGHAAGDEVLCTVARICSRNLRQEDLIARIGGDEFAVQLPDLVAADAAEIIDRVRARLEETPITLSDGRRLGVTFSAGVADIDPTRPAMVSVGRADQLLYDAKCAGRNRVRSGSPAPERQGQAS